MAVTIIPIGTRIPKARPHTTELNSPVTAINTDNGAGDLRPIAGLGTGATLAKAGALRSLYKLHVAWLTWTQNVDMVKSEMPSNSHRFYFTADAGYDAPQSSNYTMAIDGEAANYPCETRDMGVVAPTNPVTLTEYGAADPTYDDAIVSYVYTYVTDWGEESAPSDVSTLTTISGGKYVSLRGFVDPGIDHITHIRVYRLESGDSGDADYMAIQVKPGSIAGTNTSDVPLSTITSTSYELFDANHASSPTGLITAGTDIIPSEYWAEPPDDLIGLTQYVAGVLIGFYDNILCFSEPMIPYAWPVSYRKSFDYDVVGLGVYGETIVVLTKANPYLVQGTDPAGMLKKKLSSNKGCVSKRGIVSTQYGVIYPSEDGLYLVDGADVKCITDKLYSAEQWSALSPENLIGVYYDDCYYGFFLGTDIGICLDLAEHKLYDFNLDDINIYGAYVEELSGDLYLLGAVGSTYKRYEWGGGSDLTYTWQTKNFKTHPVNFEVAQIIGPYDAGDITLTYLYDWEDSGDDPAGVTQDITVSDSEFVWLPAGELHRNIAFRLSGKSKVDEIRFAGSPEELVHD